MSWYWIYYPSLLSNLLPLLGGIIFFRKLDKLQYYFFLYAILIILVQICDSTIVRLGYYSVWFFEVFLLIEMVFFIWFFNKWQPMKKWELNISILIFIGIIVLEIFKYFILHTEKEVSYTFPLIIIFFIVQSSMMILKTFDLNDTEFNKSYIFWIAFARLIYFMAILPFNIFAFIGNHISDELKETYGYVDAVFNHFANITLNVLMMYSFKCRK